MQQFLMTENLMVLDFFSTKRVEQGFSESPEQKRIIGRNMIQK